MGSGSSKIGKQELEEDFPKGSVPSTPILTPKVKEYNALDPRSPSTHISRTPLQLLSAAAEKLEDLKQSELYSFGNETPVNSKKILLGVDPRSPTTDFQRTPIVLNVVDLELPKKIHNKNFDKVRRSTIITTPTPTPEKPNIVSPKLLESSPIKPKTEINKRKSFVGLLETNIDFTETDLDTVLLEKCRIKEKSLHDGTPALRNHGILKTENVDPRSPTSDFLRTPIQIVKKIGDMELNEETDSVIELEVEKQNEEKSEIMEANSENISVEEQNNVEQILPTNEAHDVNADNVLQNVENPLAIDDVVQIEGNSTIVLDADNVINITPEILTETKSALVTPPITEVIENCKPSISPIPNETKSAPVTPPLVNITDDVKELDKKLTNLIYQDNIVICPRIVKLKENGNRLPLKNRNISEPEKKKSAQKLKVSDKPRKSDYVVSKIPVFKEKGRNIEVQCENTPPRNMEKRNVKVKKSHWDSADNTLVI